MRDTNLKEFFLFEKSILFEIFEACADKILIWTPIWDYSKMWQKIGTEIFEIQQWPIAHGSKQRSDRNQCDIIFSESIRS